MKKTMGMTLVFFFLLSAHPALGDSAPVMYKVTGRDGHALFLLGTVHVGREDMYPLGDALEEAWQAADVLAVEADVYAMQQNPLLAARCAWRMMYGPGNEAKNHLPPEAYALGVEKLGRPEAALNRMKPMAWVSLAEEKAFERLGYTADWGVDTVLLRRAHLEGKAVEELEGLDFQLQLMDVLPDDACGRVLLDLLCDSADGKLEDMVNLWRGGKEGELAALLAAERNIFPEDMGEAYRTYSQMLYEDRNIAFARQAEDFLQGGKTALMAVGSAHVLGEGGLADRLARKGYLVEKISP